MELEGEGGEYNRTIMAQLMAQNIPIKLPQLSLSLSLSLFKHNQRLLIIHDGPNNQICF